MLASESRQLITGDSIVTYSSSGHAAYALPALWKRTGAPRELPLIRLGEPDPHIWQRLNKPSRKSVLTVGMVSEDQKSPIVVALGDVAR